LETDIVIIGSGITGLSIARHLKKANKNFIVLEESEKEGGVIQTHTRDGFTWEKGPNTGMISNTEVVELIEDLSDLCTLEKASDLVKKRYVLKNNKWQALPSGVFSAVTTPLFTFADKLRVLGEPFRNPGTDPNENLADLVKRRLGKSFLDYAIDPFIMGVYAGDPSQLIPKYALPKLYNLEQDYGSFIKGAFKKSKEPKTDLEKKVTKEPFSFIGGLSSLTAALVKFSDNKNFIFSAKDVAVSYKSSNKFVVSYTKEDKQVEILAKKVITTVGAFKLPSILPFVQSDIINKISSLQHAKVVEVAIGFKKWEGKKLDAFGGLIPFKENKEILGIMFMSSLISGRAPENGAMFSVFAGGLRRPEVSEYSDEKIKKLMQYAMTELMESPDFEPEIYEVKRYKKAIPQYGIESEDRFDAVHKIQSEYDGLFIGGNLIDGIGMADRILQAKNISKLII